MRKYQGTLKPSPSSFHKKIRTSLNHFKLNLDSNKVSSRNILNQKTRKMISGEDFLSTPRSLLHSFKDQQSQISPRSKPNQEEILKNSMKVRSMKEKPSFRKNVDFIKNLKALSKNDLHFF